MTVKAVWHIVKESAKRIGVAQLAPHDLRRTCARLCHASGGELEQIQFLLGHVSVQTTERYLGCNSGFDRPSMIVLASSRILELGVELRKGCRRSASNPPLWLRFRRIPAHLDLLPRANVEVKDRAEFEAENHSRIRRARGPRSSASSFDR
jgi:Phage integrase family